MNLKRHQQRLRIVALSLGIVMMAVSIGTARAVSATGMVHAVGAKAHPILPPHHPSRNFRLASVNTVLASIDAARSTEEGLGALSFDAARFDRLSVSQQIFVMSNLERTTRGLAPAMAMVNRLDVIAANAARHDQDPVDFGRGFASNWSSAPRSLGQYAFFADFGWMYDDGPPPQYIFRNVDCVRAGQSGCWGHRDNILSNPSSAPTSCPRELVTGTGFALNSADGPSLTQIFEVACSPTGSSAVFTWRFAVSYLKIPVTQSGIART